ncbi:hypothetical protein D3C72_1589940 [compost metagenome]
MPSEKTTICQGAPRNTWRVPITGPRAATASRITAPKAATALTGTPSGSRPKKPTSSSASTTQPARKVSRSRIASAGFLRRAMS